MLGEAEYHIRRPMPGITAGASRTPQHGGWRGWWGQARPMGAVSHRPHARALGQTPQKPPGQIPCQQLHPKGIREKERFWLEERRKNVRRYDTTRP
jgi:hypothetical protein